MAGALGLALAGPRVYRGVQVEDAMMGNGRREATAADIRSALTLYQRADAMLIVPLHSLRFSLLRQAEEPVEIDVGSNVRRQAVERVFTRS